MKKHRNNPREFSRFHVIYKNVVPGAREGCGGTEGHEDSGYGKYWLEKLLHSRAFLSLATHWLVPHRHVAPEGNE